VRRSAPRRNAAWVAALLAVVAIAPLAVLQAQEKPSPALPADIDATFRVATAQHNPQMLEDAAAAAESLQKYEVAQKLLEGSLAIEAEVDGQQSVAYGRTLEKLGTLELNQGKGAEAEAFYVKAVSTLGDRPEAGAAIIDLGTAELINKQNEQALTSFQRATVIDPAHAATAQMWTAVTQERLKNLTEAEAQYKAAVATADPATEDAATIREVYAQFLQRQDRQEEAKQIDEQAASLRKAQSAQRGDLAFANPDVQRITTGMTPPKVTYKVEPEYSELARIAKYQASVALYVAIGEDGVVHDVKVRRGSGLGLDEKAIEAVRKWQFQPAMKDGRAVSVAATIEVNFRLL
jgi:TonB family protein